MVNQTMTVKTITVTVKLFSVYQEAFGVSQLYLEFPAHTPVSQVLQAVIERRPELSQWREVTRFGVNLAFVEPDTQLQLGDEVVLIPPVSGG